MIAPVRLKDNEWLAIIYSGLFDFPLTVAEAKYWAINLGDRAGRERVVVVGEKLIRKRKIREKISADKMKVATSIVPLLRRIPTIEAIFLTGSVAVGNAKKDADIDLMIVTRPATLWITRAIVVAVLRLLKRYPERDKQSLGRDKICTNIFLDTDHLEVRNKNLYTAHEVLQAKCLWDRGGIQGKWLLENKWTEKFLPRAWHSVPRGSRPALPAGRPALFDRSSLLLSPLEILFFFAQYFYQKPKQTREKVGWGYAFFHPRDLSAEVTGKFSKKLAKLGIMLEC